MKKFPGLDCGSCGAPTCKALAEDIVRGDASENDCVYYLRENLHRLSEEVSILADDLAAGGNGRPGNSEYTEGIYPADIQRDVPAGQ